MAIFIGIDPGASGALCALDSQTGATEFHPTPNTKTLVTPAAVFDWLNDVDAGGPIRVIGIEQVHAIQGAGATTTFNFGHNAGQLYAICQIAGFSIDFVRPIDWQRLVKAPSRKKAGGPAGLKKAIAQKAHQLYPKADLFGPRGGLMDGRSDALCIAHYMFWRYTRLANENQP